MKPLAEMSDAELAAAHEMASEELESARDLVAQIEEEQWVRKFDADRNRITARLNQPPSK